MLQATYRKEGDITVVDLSGSATEALQGPIPEVMAVIRRGDRKIVVNMARRAVCELRRALQLH